MKAFRRPLCTVLLGTVALAAPGAEDHRAWQHGVNLLEIDGRHLLIWSSWGNPPQPKPPGDWEHDIYYAWLDASRPTLAIRTLVSHPEAQEPASAAVNRRGTLLVTWEDGHGGIHQNAGLWDKSLRAITPDGLRVRDGGHSGHVAALGERFLIAYGEGWVAGGAFLDRGTGMHLHARIVEADGALGPEIDIATGRNPDRRESWPLAAASEHNWLVVWQRYPERSLQGALIDPEGRVAKRLRIARRLTTGHDYDVRYAPGLGCFVVLGATERHGFVTLIDTTGNIVATNDRLPRPAGESQIVLAPIGPRRSPERDILVSGPSTPSGSRGPRARDGAVADSPIAGEITAAYPTVPTGIAVLRVSRAGIRLLKHIDHPHAWDYTGTAGTFTTPDRVLFATLSKSGIKLIAVDGVAGD